MFMIYSSMTLLETTRVVYFLFISQAYQAEVQSEINKHIKSAIWTSSSQQSQCQKTPVYHESIKN